MEYPEFSVLMSLYVKEKASYFEECMQSMLCQTILPSEFVIVEDGPLNDELRESLDKYIANYPQLIKTVRLEKNQGLGVALAEGILHCENELIARMDTDDIAVDERFRKQLDEFIKNSSLDVCGSHIIEFDGSIDCVLSTRKVPLTHNEIAKYQKQRSAVNHMTVMFKKQAVLDAGNYQSAPLMEDDYLWVRMLQHGSTFMNIDENLVYARTGAAMIERRGGWQYFKKYCKGRKMIYDTGYINFGDYIKTIFVQFIVALMPSKLRLFVFTTLLRR